MSLMVGETNLIDVIKTLELKIDQLKEEKAEKIHNIAEQYDNRINNYKKALEVNRELNTTCTKCEGEKYITICNGYESYDKAKCDRCGGTGKEPKSKEVC